MLNINDCMEESVLHIQFLQYISAMLRKGAYPAETCPLDGNPTLAVDSGPLPSSLSFQLCISPVLRTAAWPRQSHRWQASVSARDGPDEAAESPSNSPASPSRRHDSIVAASTGLLL